MVSAELAAFPALVMFVPKAAATIVFLQILAPMTFKDANPLPTLSAGDQLVAAATA